MRRDNPTSLILSAAMLLARLDEKRGSDNYLEAGATLEKTINRVLENPEKRTAVLGGPLGTRAFAAEVVQELESGCKHAP